jgi:uncharacterized coiled-coil protein SlyX
MNDEPSSTGGNARLTALEELFTHLQRTVADLNDVVIQQQRRIEILEQRLDRALNELETVAGKITEERRPEDDKPPHY